MALFFEWDPVKAKSNLAKHNVDFGEASTVIVHDLSMTYPDPDHSIEEERFITFGVSASGRFLVVAHTSAAATFASSARER